MRLIGDYHRPERASVPLEPRGATGCSCTEAPRGVLFHRYRLDSQGTISDAKIVPPTSQNQTISESDLARLVGQNLDLPVQELTRRCEQIVATTTLAFRVPPIS
ncbi:MAG: hypothetical protein HYX74_08545 [Acidobacteria bacterium]|nr:hypothetical protein [Acidobacteriota bacterium]